MSSGGHIYVYIYVYSEATSPRVVGAPEEATAWKKSEGDPLWPLIFALDLQPVLEDAKARPAVAQLVAYLYDAGIAGSPTAGAAAFSVCWTLGRDSRAST